MSDRFKFRAWDASEKEMIYCSKLYRDPDDWFIGLLEGDVDDKDILMQCTGLEDTNGKFIYEGDIVNYNSPIDGKRYKTTMPTLNNFHWYSELDGKEDFEVIGNKFEHPELSSKTE